VAGLKIGVFADGFRLGEREGIRKAAEVGAAGVQIRTTRGEFAPENLSPAGRTELRRFVESCGLEISATCADYGKGFVDAELNRELVPKVRANVDLAADLGVGIITTHVGVIPEDRSAPVRAVLLAALEEIGRHAEERGVVLATETGPESGRVLRDFLDELATDAVRVNFDPANLVMAGFDHIQAVEDLAPCIAHTHAKDGQRGGGELPLGGGDVDFPRYVAALRSTGFDGYYAVERECGDDPEADIRAAVKFLASLPLPGT
jgi:sugar phosphate isomerase/epimerase